MVSLPPVGRVKFDTTGRLHYHRRMLTIRAAAHPTDDDIARLARLMVNIETDSRMYEWVDEKDAKSALAAHPALGFNSVTVDQPGTAPFAFTLLQPCATILVPDAHFAAFFAALQRLTHALGRLRARYGIYRVRDSTIHRTGFTWDIRALREIVDLNLQHLILIDSDGSLTSAIAGREHVTFEDLFGPSRAKPDIIYAHAWFHNNLNLQLQFWRRGLIKVPAQIVVKGLICGFVLFPNTPQACLLPGYCAYNGCINDYRCIVWETLVPINILLSLPADMPRWVMPDELPD